MGTGSWPRWWALYNGKRQKKKKKKSQPERDSTHKGHTERGKVT